MSKPPKIDRKDLKAPDAFVIKGRSALNWFAGHQGKVFPVLGALVAGAAIYYGYDAWKSSKHDKAWEHYADAAKEPAPLKWEALKKVAGDSPSSRAAQLATVTLAEHFYEEAKKEALAGKPPEANAQLAIDGFTRALTFGGLIIGEKQLLLVNRGNAKEVVKKLDEAQADYKSASDMVGDGKGWALLNLARAYEMKADTAKALETYEKVAVDFANSEYGKQAKHAARRLKSPLLNPPKAG